MGICGKFAFFSFVLLILVDTGTGLIETLIFKWPGSATFRVFACSRQILLFWIRTIACTFCSSHSWPNVPTGSESNTLCEKRGHPLGFSSESLRVHAEKSLVSERSVVLRRAMIHFGAELLSKPDAVATSSKTEG